MGHPSPDRILTTRQGSSAGPLRSVFLGAPVATIGQTPGRRERHIKRRQPAQTRNNQTMTYPPRLSLLGRLSRFFSSAF